MTGNATGDAPTGVIAPPGYELVRTIGRGASSTVFEAVQRSTGRRVAMKILGSGTPDEDAHRLFDRERSVMAQLGEHPNVVSIVDAGAASGQFWIAMEYCPYGAIAAGGERLPVADVVAALAGVSSALETAHDLGLVHCDVKPANILRTRYGQPALADFGVSRLAVSGGHGSTLVGYTLDHVSPEFLEGERPTGASDVYSLGTTIWELIEGHPPFRRAGDAAVAPVMRRIQSDPLPPLTRDEVPSELADLIAAMAAKDPAQRPGIGQVAAVARDLRAAVGEPDPSGWSQNIPAPRASGSGSGSGSGDATPSWSFPVQDGSPSTGTGGFAARSVTAGSFPYVSTTTGGTGHVPRPGIGTWTGPSPGEDATRIPYGGLGERPQYGAMPSPAPPRRTPQTLLVVVLAAVAVLVAGGGITAWRIAAASSASPQTSAPVAVSTAPSAPSSTVAPPPVSSAVSVPAGSVGGTGTSASGGGGGGGGHVSTSAPSSTDQAPATVAKIDLSQGSCQYSSSDQTCVQSDSAVSYVVKVTDSRGEHPTSGCSVDSVVTGPDGATSTVSTSTCNSGTAQWTANGVGQYSINLVVTYNGVQAGSKAFSLTRSG